jgi:hypothetical protein
MESKGFRIVVTKDGEIYDDRKVCAGIAGICAYD